MIAVIVLLVIAGAGACAAFSAPTSRNRIVFALCCVIPATGVVAFLVSAECIGMTDAIYGQLGQKGDGRIIPNTPYDWLNHWVNPYFLLISGILLSTFGVGALLCFGVLRIAEWRRGRPRLPSGNLLP